MNINQREEDVTLIKIFLPKQSGCGTRVEKNREPDPYKNAGSRPRVNTASLKDTFVCHIGGGPYSIFPDNIFIVKYIFRVI